MMWHKITEEKIRRVLKLVPPTFYYCCPGSLKVKLVSDFQYDDLSVMLKDWSCHPKDFIILRNPDIIQYFRIKIYYGHNTYAELWFVDNPMTFPLSRKIDKLIGA